MATKSVFCISTSHGQTERIVEDLRNAGFTSSDLSILLPDKGLARDFAHVMRSKAPEGATTGAGTGGLVGGALGWLVGIGALAIPGAGPFIAAGPVMAALGGFAIGATVGGISGGLIGMGIPELEAKMYEGKLMEGNTLLSVHTEDASAVARAKEIFSREGAQDICVTGESATPKRAATAGNRIADQK